jgi:hypothetical protein
MLTFFWIMTQAFAQVPVDQMQKRIDELEKQVNERRRNTFYFGNFYYNLIPPVDLCLEYSYWNTKYQEDFSDGKDNRIQTLVISKW